MHLKQFLEEANKYSFDDSILKSDKQGRDLFLTRWPLEKVKKLTVEEYCGLNKDSFIYWLEFKKLLAGIGGGSSFKFGVYGQPKEKKYFKRDGTRSKEIQGTELQSDFKRIRDQIISIIDYAKAGDIDAIEKMEKTVSSMVLLKIITIYAPEHFMTVLSKVVLVKAATALEVMSGEEAEEVSCIYLNFVVNRKLNQLKETKNWSDSHRGTFIWQLFKEHLEDNGQKNRELMLTVGMYLSKYGDDHNQTRFPGLGWKEVYKKFYPSLGNSKEIDSFCNSLKNARDTYDGHLENSRQGWKEESGEPIRLSGPEQRIFDKYNSYSEPKFWRKIEKLINEADEIALETELSTEESTFRSPLNQILCGPPGTGKTYTTIFKAIEIIDGKKYKDESDVGVREEALRRFNQLKDNGQIEFVTFHQSYSYEEFVEGLFPKTREGTIVYEVKDGVFKKFIKNASNSRLAKKYNGISANPTVWRISLKLNKNEKIFNHCLEKGLIGLDFDVQANFEEVSVEEFYSKHPDSSGQNSFNMFVDEMEIGDIVCVFNDARSIKAIGVITSDYQHNNSDKNMYAHTRSVNWLDKSVHDIYELNGQKRMMTPAIHRLPQVSAASLLKAVGAEDKSEIASPDLDKRYVFIIDEINRGNISKIFGELITLLEPDKREGNGGFPLRLPYSSEEFVIPKNVYLLGTMNTADRSIALIDIALRRRFVFEEKAPRLDLIREDIDGVPVRQIMGDLNDKISLLLGRDYQIGHSYLMADKVKTIPELKEVWFSSILPLLNEYFYEDWQKLELLVGPFLLKSKKIKGLEKLHLNSYSRYSFKDISTSDEDFKKSFSEMTQAVSPSDEDEDS